LVVRTLGCEEGTQLKELNEYQVYLLQEFVEDWREGHMSRRDMVRRTVYLTGGVASAATVLLSMGCAPQPSPTAAATKPAAAATTAPAATSAPAPTSAPAATSPATAQPTPATGAPSPAASSTSAATPAATGVAAATKPAGAASPAATGAASPAAGATGAASPVAGAAGTAAPAAAQAPPPTPSGPRSPLSVKADDPAVDARDVDFPGEAGKVLGYLVKPKAAGTYPTLIVIHENRGLTEHIRDVTRRAAKEGYVALAVDLLSRQGGTKVVNDDARAAGLLGQAKPDDLVADLNAGAKFVVTDSSAAKDKLGAFGFCFGGGYTWRLIGANHDVKAAVPFYGPAPQDTAPLSTTKAAVYAIFAGNDNFVNPGMPKLEDALKKAGVPYELKVYPGVNHAFHNDTGPAWNEQAAVDAWKNMIAWFKKYLA